MAVDFGKFDKTIDIAGLTEDLKNIEETGGSEFDEVPVGNYDVKVQKMELTASKKGDPMVSIWFKILAGEHKNSIIFMNQLVTQAFQIHMVNELLRSMDTDVNVEFKSYKQFADMIADVYEAVDGKLEFALEYRVNNKGYNSYKITDVFDVE